MLFYALDQNAIRVFTYKISMIATRKYELEIIELINQLHLYYIIFQYTRNEYTRNQYIRNEYTRNQYNLRM